MYVCIPKKNATCTMGSCQKGDRHEASQTSDDEHLEVFVLPELSSQDCRNVMKRYLYRTIREPFSGSPTNPTVPPGCPSQCTEG